MRYPLGEATPNWSRYEDARSHRVNPARKPIECSWCGKSKPYLRSMKDKLSEEHPSICDKCYELWEKKNK